MLFNKHLHLEGTHAFLSASNSSWVNYDDEKLEARFTSAMAAQRGTELHALARDCIRLGVKLPDTQNTLNMYVNDAIGYRMIPEQTLFYSYNCYGTPDTIGFRRGMLRIHDLKTGVTATSERQLKVYAALFCLEYEVKPMEIESELRIYQNNEIRVYDHDPDEITHIMSKIVMFDKRIEEIRAEVDA